MRCNFQTRQFKHGQPYTRVSVTYSCNTHDHKDHSLINAAFNKALVHPEK